MGVYNEIGVAPALLAGLDLRGTVTTMDALLTQRSLAEQILGQGGHYLMKVKDNQPGMREARSELFEVGSWMPSEVDTRYWKHRTCGKRHGRLETCTLESSTVLDGWLDWPGVRQVMRRTSERVIQRETTYAVTSLAPDRAGAQEHKELWREHWGIENRVHYVRDGPMGEVAGRATTGGTPQAMAALRNCILDLLRRNGWKNRADALRHYGAHPDRALALIGAVTA